MGRRRVPILDAGRRVREMKSVSLPARLTLQFGDEISPDLSRGAGGNAKMRALIRDTDAVLENFRGE